MRGRSRGLCMLLGCGLIAAGWGVTSATSVRKQAVAEVARPIAADMIEQGGGGVRIDGTTLRTAGTTPYALGVAAMIVGAIVFGYCLPRGAR